VIDDVSYDAGDTDWEKIIKKIHSPGGLIDSVSYYGDTLRIYEAGSGTPFEAEIISAPDSTVFATLYTLGDTATQIRDAIPDLNQTNTYLSPIYSTDYYISNEGDDGNSGSKGAPLETVAEIESRSGAGDVIGFRRGDILRDEFDIKVNQSVMTFTDFHGNRDLVRLSAFEPAYGWTKNGSYTNIYYKSISHSVGVAENYNNIYVVQIDSVLYETNPYDAVTFLARVDGLTQCDTVPGSFFATSTSANPLTIQLHTIDSADPDSSIYRYEVISREFALDGYARDSFYVNGMHFFGGGDGYGVASGGDGAHFDRCFFDGGSTHHIVAKSGVIENSVFTRSLLRTTYPSDFIAVTFYEADASGNRSYLQNCGIYDLPSVATYSHSSGSGDHDFVSYRRNKIFNIAAEVFGVDNTHHAYVHENYVDGCSEYYRGIADSVSMSGNVILNQRYGVIISHPTLSPEIEFEMHNNFIHSGASGGIIFSPNENVNLNATGNIFYVNPSATGASILYSAIGTVKSYRNIFIIDGTNAVNSLTYIHAKGDGVTPATNYEGDNNVFIFVAGDIADIRWSSTTPTQNYTTLSAWRSGTGQDGNSIFIDLSSDDDGLKEIFIDPGKGDWRLNTSGDYYSQIAALGAGMTTPPVRWLQRPSTIQAMAKEVENGTVGEWDIFTPQGAPDDQVITFDTSTNIITLENGGTIDLSSLSEDALITPHYEGFDLQTITPVASATRRDTVDFSNQIDGYFRVNLDSLSVHTELVFLNPHTTEVPTYRLHLDNPSGDTIIFPENLLLHSRDTVGTRYLEEGCLMRIWYDGTNYFSDDTCGVETEVVIESVYKNSEFQDIVTHAINNGYTLPADSILIYGDSLITRAKANEWWSKLDIFMCLASPGSKQFALIDWVNPGGADDPAEIGTMTWTAGTGMTGGGSTSNYINTNYNPSSDAVNFSQNSASFGGWVTTVQSNGTGKYVYQQTSRNYYLSDNTMVGTFRLNQSAGSTAGNASASLPGLVMGSRTSSSSCTVHHNNGTSYDNTGSSTSAVFADASFTIFSATTPSNATVAFFFAGSSMDGQKASMYSDLGWFLSKL
jgi:hypothetical protein